MEKLMINAIVTICADTKKCRTENYECDYLLCDHVADNEVYKWFETYCGLFLVEIDPETVNKCQKCIDSVKTSKEENDINIHLYGNDFSKSPYK